MGNGNPSKHVENCRKSLNVILDAKGTEQDKAKATKELEDALREMNQLLYGSVTTDAPGDRKNIGKLIEAIRSSDLTEVLVLNIRRLGFETPKLTARIVQFWLRDSSSYDAIRYFQNHPQLVPHLIDSFPISDVTIPVSNILKEALMHPEILKMMLERKETKGGNSLDAPGLWKIMEYTRSTDFGTASEALAILDVIVNCQEDLSPESERREKGGGRHALSQDKLWFHRNLFKRWLGVHENEIHFLSEIHSLLRPEESPATKIHVLNLLYKMLKCPDYFHIAMRYANVPEHLKLMMRLLEAKNRRIQVVAYNVFKIFFACAFPDPPEGIAQILLPNKQKIIKFLEALKKSTIDRNGGIQDEVDLINSQLKKIQTPVSTIRVTKPPGEAKDPSPSALHVSSEDVNGAITKESRAAPEAPPKLRLTLSEISVSDGNQGDNEDENVPSIISRTAIVLQPSERDADLQPSAVNSGASNAETKNNPPGSSTP